MKILFATAEASPFIKTGGLGDVAGSLPKAIKNQGHDIRVVLPLHSSIKEEYRKQFSYVGYFYVDLAWKHLYCGVFEYVHDGVTYYFLDNEDYFKRLTPYGSLDDGERYTFFCKAILLLARYLDFQFDVLHANDWHTGLAPVYLNEFRRGDDFYKDARSLFTIHNIRYQGNFPQNLFVLTGLDVKLLTYRDLEFNGQMSFMKVAIVHSTKFNTVSKTYAQEIRDPYFAYGLHEVINYYSDKLVGIVNGIDYDYWDPAKDKIIFKQYSPKNLANKYENKTKLQESLGLPIDKDKFMIGMVTRINDMKGFDIIGPVLDEILQADLQLVILGTGENHFEDMLRHFAYKYPEKFAARIYFSETEASMIYAASDLYLMPSVSEPCGISQLIAMKYGTVPLVRSTGGLRDTVIPFDRNSSQGYGFVINTTYPNDLKDKVYEALDLYKNDRETFDSLKVKAMQEKYDWDQSSIEYIELYRSL